MIDADKVAKMNPRSLKILDFTNPQGYDSESTGSDQSVHEQAQGQSSTNNQNVDNDETQQNVPNSGNITVVNDE